jgi:hypothetical protein
MKAEALGPDSWIPTYNRACLETVEGDPELAMQLLQQAQDKQQLVRELLETDQDLASLRSRPDFKALLEQASDEPW